MTGLRLPVAHRKRATPDALRNRLRITPREPPMSYRSINFEQKFRLFSERWKPKVVAEMNDYQFKIVKLEGDFIWHDHKDTDETFIVVEGTLRIDFRDGAVHLSAGGRVGVPQRGAHQH